MRHDRNTAIPDIDFKLRGVVGRVARRDRTSRPSRKVHESLDSYRSYRVGRHIVEGCTTLQLPRDLTKSP
jgi:hypothetical protein